MSMSVDLLKIRDFIITFTQKGIYLDPKNINKLKLKRNNVVKVSLLLNDQLTSECYTISYSKTSWDIEKENLINRKINYSDGFFNKYAKEENVVILGYLEWRQLTSEILKSKLFSISPILHITKIGNVSKAKEIKVSMKNINYPEKNINISSSEQPLVISKDYDFPILYFKDEYRNFDLRKASLTRLTNIGKKRKEILLNNGINNIVDLITKPYIELKKIDGISDKLINMWFYEYSKILDLMCYEIRAKHFSSTIVSKKPESNILLISDKTKMHRISILYAQYFIKEHPVVESSLLTSLNENFGLHHNILMQTDNVIKMNKKDGTQEITIYGPWIIQMLGLKDELEANEFLIEFEDVIMDNFSLFGENDIIKLVGPQENIIDPDQLLNSIIEKFTIPSFSIEKIFYEEDNILVLDTCILIDERLSYIFMKARQGGFGTKYISYKPNLLIPSIVTFEIKSMIDRRTPKENQYKYANRELMRLKTLHDFGYINLEYLGETPLIPPIIQQDNKTWTFMNSLRDEYILKNMKSISNTLLISSDRSLATSAYIRGYNVLYIEPLDKTLPTMIKKYDLKNVDESELDSKINKISYENNIPKIRIKDFISI